MGSSFSGINSALTALQVHRKVMDVVGQNLANVNTPGYTKQRADVQELTAGGTPSVWVTPREVGGGVGIDSISRGWDEMTAANVDSRTADHALLAGRAETLSAIDSITGEPSTNGLAAQMNAMWKAWQAASNTVGSSADGANRQGVLTSTQTVVDTLKARVGDLTSQWEVQLKQANAEVDEVNSSIRSIAALNDQIQVVSTSGGNANELMDKRDTLVTRVVELTGATTQQGGNGKVDVLLGGNTLVSGTTSSPLVLSYSSTLTMATATPASFTFSVSGFAAPVTRGSLAARKEALGTEIPAAMRGYDAVADAIGKQVNYWQAKGQDAAGVATTADAATSRAARPVFTGAGSSGTFTATSLTLAISKGSDLGLATAGNAVNDGSNAKMISGIGTATSGPPDLWTPGVTKSPDTTWTTYVSGLASRASAADLRATAAQNGLTSAIKEQQGAAGVNIDEETANLIAAQRAYQGAARVLTAVDEMLDVLINKTGLVGR